MRLSSSTYGGHYSALLRLGLPIVVGQVGTIVLSFADTLMVGHHSMEELAAASFVGTLFNLFSIAAMGFSYGLTPVVGQLFGRGETHRIGAVMKAAMLANAIVSVLVMVCLGGLYCGIHLLGQPAELLPLMRAYLLVLLASVPFLCLTNALKQFFDAIGHTTTPMIVLLTGNLLNIIGNYLLIYGAWGLPEMGLVGAGVSTLVSRVVMLLMLGGVFFFAHRYRHFGRDFMRQALRRADFVQLNALGWPVAAQMGMETAAFSLTAILVGWIGTEALAAHQIVLTVSQVFFMVYYGLAAAVAVRVSHFYGQGDIVSLRATTTAGFRLILVVAATFSVPVMALSSQIGTWFTDAPNVVLLVESTIPALIIYQFGDGLQCTFANALRGLGVVRPMMWAAFVAYFVVSLPLSWLLGIRLEWGLVGVWSAFPVCLTTAGVLYWLIFRRALRGA